MTRGAAHASVLPSLGGDRARPQLVLHASALPVWRRGPIRVPQALLARRVPTRPRVAATVEEDLRRRVPATLDISGRGGVLVAAVGAARPKESWPGPPLALPDDPVLDPHWSRLRRSGF